MSPRAITSLIFSVILLTVVIGTVSSIMTKNLPTDTVLAYEENDRFQQVILRNTDLLVRDFLEDQWRSRAVGCVSWYSSERIHVIKQSKEYSAANYYPWARARNSDRFSYGLYYYRYRFYRLTENPVRIIFRFDSISPLCGYRGEIPLTPTRITSIDVITDFFGLERIGASIDQTPASTPQRPPLY